MLFNDSTCCGGYTAWVIYEWLQSIGGMVVTGKLLYLVQNLSQCHFVHHEAHVDIQDLNMCLYVQGLTTSFLISHMYPCSTTKWRRGREWRWAPSILVINVRCRWAVRISYQEENLPYLLNRYSKCWEWWWMKFHSSLAIDYKLFVFHKGRL